MNRSGRKINRKVRFCQSRSVESSIWAISGIALFQRFQSKFNKASYRDRRLQPSDQNRDQNPFYLIILDISTGK